MYLLVARQLVIMLIIAFAGFVVARAFHFEDRERKFVSKMLIYFINPCLIVSEFNMDFDIQKLKNLGFMFALAIVCHFAMILIALIFCRSKSEEAKELDSIDKIATVFTNCGFIGIPLIDGVFPNSNGVFYLLGFIVIFNVFLWTFGYMMVCGKINFRKVITNPNIIALVIGMIIFCLPFRLPYVIEEPVLAISRMNTAMAMILLGLLIANFHDFNHEYIIRCVKICVFKYLIVFAAVLGIAFSAFRLFSQMQDIRLMCYVAFIASLCPVGMSVSSFAVLFEKDESYSGLLVLVTSAVCVVMLPLSVGIAELVF